MLERFLTRSSEEKVQFDKFCKAEKKAQEHKHLPLPKKKSTLYKQGKKLREKRRKEKLR